MLLPYEILAETLNVFGRRMGRKYASLAAETLLSLHADGELRFIPPTTRIVSQAAKLQTTTTGGPSFVDCLVMAYADACTTVYVFGFDATFRKNGYLLPGDSSPSASAA